MLLTSFHVSIQVERVEVKDVRLPKQMQRAMAAEAEAAREARAKVGCRHTRLITMKSKPKYFEVVLLRFFYCRCCCP